MMKVRNPRNGIYDYEIHITTAEEVADICRHANEAQKKWSQKNVSERIATLEDWKSAVHLKKEDLLKALSIDTGRWNETILEVDLVANSIDRWCGIATQYMHTEDEKTSSIPFITLQQDLVPVGVIGVISPWNFPILLSLIDTIPALLAGCAVVVKPSEITPRFIAVMQEIVATVPALENVLQYITGDGSTGAALVQHCNLICFTGSTATGKKVYANAAAQMIPVFLELGGKDPVIIMDDVDIDRTAAAVLWSSTVNAGQSCLSIERVYVHENIHDDFVAALVAKANTLTLNKDNLIEGHIGPIIFDKQVTIIDEQLQDALAKGATIVCGNAACEGHDGGWYCKPTILTNVNHNMLIMQEETFGPIIPIMKFTTVEEAITMANDSKYGLSSAVFCNDELKAKAIANEMIGGAISINDGGLTAIMHEGEKNSFKMSGIGGTRMGPAAIKRFMKQKVFIKNNLTTHSPWWFK